MSMAPTLPRRRWRIATGILSAVVLGAALVVPAGAMAAGPFPVTVKSKLGTATISKPPERVIALDYPSADAALALGVMPVAIEDVSYIAGGVQAWTKRALRGRKPALLKTFPDVPLERIAALKPDLILATNAYTLPQAYDKLRRIAPVVAWAEGAGVDRWETSTVRIGRALGREARAKRLIAGFRSRAEKVRKRHPEFARKTVSLFNYVGGKAHVINATSDFSIRFLSSLGFRLPPRVAALKGDAAGRATVSRERFGVLDADFVLGTSTSAKELRALGRDALFQRLPAVAEGRYLSLAIGDATSLAFPSLLSVNYALDKIVPRLAAAAR